MVTSGFNLTEGGDPMISGILMTAQALLGHAVVGAASDKS
jgi:hypothetical protein